MTSLAQRENGIHCQAVDLKCEYLVDPIGIDEGKPRLSWRMADDRRGAIQSAYRLRLAADPAALASGKRLLWDSGKRSVDAQRLVYEGKELEPFTRYVWQVELWDMDGKATALSEVASFETGVMGVDGWRGSWISDSLDRDIRAAAHFRQEATLSKGIASARVYIAAAGLYELYLNGEKIGDRRLDPMFTRYDRRSLYASFDVTDQLRSGENGIGILLGNGWYNHQSLAVWGFDKAPWRGRPMFCLDLHVTYKDGTVEVISSNDDWKTSTGPIIANSIYTAERYDARLEMPGWSEAGFDDAKWAKAIYRSAPTQKIVAQALQPIRVVERIPARSVNRIDERTFVFDLGRNIAGVSEIGARGERGATLRLKHGEFLDDEGRVDLWNIDVYHRPDDNFDPFQTDLYTFKGEGEEIFSARFNYKGFQYVEVVCDRPIDLSKDSLSGLFIHSDVPKSGSIDSSNPVINGIWEATRSSYLSNLYGFPTDCPQREKNGWTGDGHIAVELGLYGFDGITIYEKWLDDHRDEQQPNGALPAIIPTGGWGYDWANGPDWTSSIALIPWTLYLFYGDTRPLEENYEAIKRFVDRIDLHHPSGLTAWGIGDWVPVKSESPVELTSSIYFFVDATILANAASLLGREQDHRRYAALATKIKKAVNRKYLDRKRGVYGSGLQTELSVPLYWGLVPKALKRKVAARLAERVRADGTQLDVGLLGSKAILSALSENGHADLAYELASRESYPSWGWWIVNGATTLHENWSLDAKKDRSLNHIMFGEVGAWLFKSPGGIRPDPEAPGFKNILLEPRFLEGLQQFAASYQSPFGLVESAWTREESSIRYAARIPPNSTATMTLAIREGQQVYLDGKPIAVAADLISLLDETKATRSYHVPAGSYQFEIR